MIIASLRLTCSACTAKTTCNESLELKQLHACACFATQVDRVKDFVFDVHDSMRRSQQIEELETLYTTTFKKLRYIYTKPSSLLVACCWLSVCMQALCATTSVVHWGAAFSAWSPCSNMKYCL
jgi:hypothetical protein